MPFRKIDWNDIHGRPANPIVAEIGPRQRFEHVVAGVRHSIGASWAKKRPVLYLSRRDGFRIRENGILSIPPIRYTPSDLAELASDYYFWAYKPQPGDVVVDVGGGMGTELPVYEGLVGSRGEVHAFEAHPKSATICREMIRANRLKVSHIHEVALWNEATNLLLSDDPESLGINSAVDSRLLAGPALRVEAVRLDDYWGDQEIHFMKINAEGAELRILEGALQTLKRVNSLVVSCHDFIADTDDSPLKTRTGVLELLKKLGFSTAFREDPRPVVRDMVYATRED